MPVPLLPRDELVARIYDVFKKHGYEGASLSDISQATGLGKGSLYHHFPGGKDDMATAVLERVQRWLDDVALTPLRGAGTPASRLRAMLKNFDELYAGGREACVLGTLTVGESRTKFADALRAAFATWIDALRDLAVEAGVPRQEAQRRAEDAVVRIEGSLVLAAGLGDPAPFRRATKSIERDLLG
jgi:AcrR family transcriptional regulator